MILNISTTHYPATDLGFLLHKHPDRFQTFELAVGKVYVFYPEKSKEKTTVSMLLDIDPIDMVHNAGKAGNGGFALAHYVNDRPYVASSFMSVALSKVFSSALNGNCREKPLLVELKFPFEVLITSILAPKGGETLIRKFFEPLGYQVEVSGCPLDARFPEWGESRYFTLKLIHRLTLKTLLSHLYILIPALDSNKHYFVSENELDKLFKKGEGWLKEHPEKEQIIRRYLVNIRSLSVQALEKLNDGEAQEEPDDQIDDKTGKPDIKEPLNNRRINMVVEKLIASGAKRVLDLGCGEGKLIRQLLKYKQFSEIVGIDVSYQALVRAKERLYQSAMSPGQNERIRLLQGSLTYRDNRMEGFDAAAVVEVIEHIDPNRLKAFERVLFEFAKPKTVVLTMPNKEYNMMWERLETDEMRHDDHRFEWTRQEFTAWAHTTGKMYNYQVEIVPVGDETENMGAPSQMAIFNLFNIK